MYVFKLIHVAIGGLKIIEFKQVRPDELKRKYKFVPIGKMSFVKGPAIYLVFTFDHI